MKSVIAFALLFSKCIYPKSQFCLHFSIRFTISKMPTKAWRVINLISGKAFSALRSDSESGEVGLFVISTDFVKIGHQINSSRRQAAE